MFIIIIVFADAVVTGKILFMFPFLNKILKQNEATVID